MIAIGHVDGPGVSQLQDRWGCWTDTYEADSFFYVTEEEWEKILWFITPVQIPEGFIRRGPLTVADDLALLPYKKELIARIDWAHGTIKQMNVLGPDGEERRMCFALGDPKFPASWRPWTLWERTVGYKLSQLKAWWKNNGLQMEKDDDY